MLGLNSKISLILLPGCWDQRHFSTTAWLTVGTPTVGGVAVTRTMWFVDPGFGSSKQKLIPTCLYHRKPNRAYFCVPFLSLPLRGNTADPTVPPNNCPELPAHSSIAGDKSLVAAHPAMLRPPQYDSLTITTLSPVPSPPETRVVHGSGFGA